jgi:hypothetical protein
MPSVAYESGVGQFDRRIGRRVDLTLGSISWADPPGLPGAPTRRYWPGRIVNVSVTGAAVEGPDDLPVAIGDRTILSYRGRDTGVTIRWSRPGVDPGVRLFGVEFVVLQRALKNEVYEAVAGDRPDEDAWRRAI